MHIISYTSNINTSGLIREERKVRRSSFSNGRICNINMMHILGEHRNTGTLLNLPLTFQKRKSWR